MSDLDLPVLPAEQRAHITDIFIPYETEGTGASENKSADPTRAICYTGQVQPFRLFDEGSRDQFAWFTKVWADAAHTVESGEDYRIKHDHGYFRAHRMHTASGYKLALRSIPERTPRLEELTKPALWHDVLLDPDLLYGGLVMACGTNGQGKSTLIASTMISRLAEFGGHGNTAEDPIEYPMEGVHGGRKFKGVCYQHSVSREDAEPGKSMYAQALSKALRAYPAITGGGTILLVGEVRDPETAAEILLAASNGHLVLTTYHGQSIVGAITRFLTMATQHLGDSARDLFASSLRAATYQRLRFDVQAEPNPNEPWKRGKFEGQMIWNPREESSSIQKMLRDPGVNIVTAVRGIADYQAKITAGPDAMSLQAFKKRALEMVAQK